MIVAVMIVIVIGVSLYAFTVLSSGWSAQNTRTGISIKIDRALEEMVREIRAAKEVGSVNNDEIRFTLDETNYYIYYMYNASDSYPPAFSQASYQLKKAPLTGGLNGSFTYGDGRLVLGDVAPPAATDLSVNGNLVTIDLNVVRGAESMRSKAVLRPRNI